MNEKERQKYLALDIAEYLTDWTNDDTSTLEFDESIKEIESYGVGYDTPCDELITNAIRHLEYIINPWNKKAIPEILVEALGFTEKECFRYWARSTPVQIVCG